MSGIFADDDSGVIASYYVRNGSDSTWQAFAYDYQNPATGWSVPFWPGPQTVTMYFEDPNGNNNSGFPTTKSIVVDSAPPTGTITISGSGPGADYVVPGPVTLTLSAADPDIGGLKGSGESANGAALVNRKLMRIGNSLSDLLAAPWETYSTSRPGWSLSDAAEGWKTVFAQFADAVGNVSAQYADQVYLDPTAPAGTFQILNAGLYTNTEAVTLAITASDGGSGLNRLQVDTSPGLATNSAWSTSTPESGTLAGTASSEFSWPADGRLNVVLASGEGARQVNLKVKDKVGNVGSLTRTLTLDKTPPTGGAILINSGAAQTNNTNVTIFVVGPLDTYSPIAAMAFSNTPVPVPSTWIAYGSMAPWVLDSSGGGTKTVYAWFKDAAGNFPAAPNASDDVTLDISPPSGTISVSPNPTTGTVTIYCNATDAATMRFSNNGSTWSTWEPYATTKASWSLVTGNGGSAVNGTRAVYAQYRDAALNISATTAATVTLDSTAPAATISINSGAAWTTSGTVTLSLTASDAIYGQGSLQMQLSNDNILWSPWETFAPSRSWNLTSGFGGTPVNGTKICLREGKGSTAQYVRFVRRHDRV